VAPTLSGITFRDAFNGPVISPDGMKVAFTRDGQLWVRSLDSEASTSLPNTEVADSPFWSPNSQHISAIPDGVVYGATWTPSGEIVLALAGQFHWSEGRLWTPPPER
jgi:Tol biopolymer transport system component